MPPHRSTPILIISQGYPPLDGGVATSTQRIARQLAHAGFLVTVVTFAYAPSIDVDDYVISELDGVVSVKRVGPFYRHHDIDENELAVARRRVYDQTLKIARACAPQVVISLYASNPGLFGDYLGNALRVPHIVCLRGNDIGRNIFSTTWLPVLNVIFQRATYVTCVNTHLMARLLTAFPQTAKKACVIRNSVVLPSFDRPREGRPYVTHKTPWPADAVVAVFIGTPREKKGIGLLLQAVATAALHSPIRLLVVGPEPKGAERRLCGALWDTLRDRGVLHCTGQRERAEALSIAAEGDLVVMPSIEDGLANGLLEGMALGLCPVASDIFSDVVTADRSGIVVPTNNVPALSQSLISAAGNSTLRKKLALEAKTVIAESFFPAREVNEYIDLIDRAIAQTEVGSNGAQ